jgi:hypothetical protein
MFTNLENEIKELGMTPQEFSFYVGIESEAFNKKLVGKMDFTAKEIKRIQGFFSEYIYSLDWLFNDDNNCVKKQKYCMPDRINKKCVA